MTPALLVNPVKAFKTALHHAAPRNAAHLYQCIAAMPDDPCAIVHEMRVVGCVLRLEVVWDLCKLYTAALTVPVVAVVAMVPVLDLVSMESVGGIQ